MDYEQKKNALLEKITKRQIRDARWGSWDFIIAQCLVWAAVGASFGTAIIAASDTAPPLVVAFFAAIPGTVIVIDRTFLFARRARWHKVLFLRLDELANDLQFKDAAVAEIADRFSKLRIEMQEDFPGMAAESVIDAPKKTV